MILMIMIRINGDHKSVTSFFLKKKKKKLKSLDLSHYTLNIYI